MTPHPYTEDQLVEQPAIGLFAVLGWQTICALEETFGEGGTLGRETKGEVVLVERLRVALGKFNPTLPPEAIRNAIDELVRDRSAMSLEAANREVYRLLKEGIPVSVPDREHGGQKTERLRVVDWENPENNDFLLVSQFSVTGTLYTCRPDLVAFVNGLPWVVIELKKPGVLARNAFDENLTHYKQQIPALFWYNALLIASNGTDSRVGSLTADWGRFFEWKRIEREDEPRRVSLEVMLRGTCDRTRILDLVENFTLFSEHKAGLVKILGQNHQYLGVNAAIRSLLRIRPSAAATLTPAPLPEGEGFNYRGGLYFSGLVERSRELRREQTSAEEFVWELLRDRRFAGLKFRRQHQIGNYIADFYCAEHKLVLEIDGEIHQTPDVAQKDATRDAYLHTLGQKILRFPNELVQKHPEDFLRQLEAEIFPSTSGRGARGEGKTPSPNGIGVFWQTQGSGKSFSMVFFAQKILRKLIGNWTFVVVTDRVELDDQIAKTFKAVGAVSETDGDECHASSGAHLRELLRGNHRYVFTLIHKFQTPELLCDRSDVIVLTDEAHRSQYDTLALNMRSALPRAMFLAFTGTPLIAGEERTREVFGDYISIYDFQQSIEDGATVPLFYENRTPELQLVNPDLNDDIYRLVEEAELDPAQEAKLERELSRQYHILTRDDRLETVAKDIVRHFLGRGFAGKAMVVSIDKATALRMHDKVKKYWAQETERVQKELGELAYLPRGEGSPEQARRDLRSAELKARLAVLTSTDMALIVSPGQNEIQQMQKLGLDIQPHRKRMNESQPPLDERFKDTADPLRLVFVCAMWLTGFDAPSCSTVYLDKPMRNHTLMQTIARANRVFPGKHSGSIVDYANVFASLEKALAIYGAGKGGKSPVKDKQQLVEELHRAVTGATAFCTAQGVNLAAIEALPVASKERLQWLGNAMDALISPDPLRRDFFAHERLVSTLYRAVKPDPAALKFAGRVACLATLAEAIRARLNPDPPDISAIMGEINTLLDDSITGMTIREEGPAALDLSKINFEALAQRVKQSKHKNTDLEVLKAAIRAQLEKMIRLNRTRADFAEKFEELIESYNNGSRNIEELFEELLRLSNSLTEEQERHIRENISEEELVIFDILTRPAPALSTEERAEVKKVARELLARLKELLVLNWRQKSTARSQLKLAIEDILDTGLPRAYSPDIYRQKCSAVFEHVYESYPERNAGIYATAQDTHC
ncbi:HsdR family type I site-specific deoxyribonuclease [Geoalkalibacter sp.]|uniref:HsdR family type I site-specific deoxyribonuclease n=1 Tax=Geoalkalibacter sp. TaxID=3041440 RepID=UPI00272EB367|nr:HsdR family type I site-specific deoxyribonuclease [Geoalkalibacter sp.]